MSKYELDVSEAKIQESILDAPQQDLNPYVWEKVGNEYHLTREAELKLTNVLDWIVSRFGIEEYSANVTGSITSNQYDEDSDVDLHVHSSLIKDGMEDEFNKVLRKEFKELFADKPEGMIGNLPIEVYFQVNPYQDMMSVGCYDLLEHKWIVGPEFKDMNYDPFGEFYKDDMRTRSAILNNIRDIIFKIHEDSIVLSETRDEDLIEEISERFVDNLKTAKDILDRARDSRSAYSAPKSKEQALKIRDSRKWKIADSAFKLMDQFGYTWILRQFSTCYKKIEENPNNIVKVVDYISNNIMNDSESREEIQENNTFDIDWGDLIVVGKNIPNGIEPVDDGISPDGVVKESGNTFEDSLDISKEDIDITLKDFKSKFVSQAFPKMDISDQSQEISIIGSAGTKARSGDIDVAMVKDATETNNIDEFVERIDETFQEILQTTDIFKQVKDGRVVHPVTRLNTICTLWPQVDAQTGKYKFVEVKDEGGNIIQKQVFVQIDLIYGDEMNVMKFGYHLLDDDHDGKKWKNGLRTILIQQTAALFDRRNLSGDELQQFGLVDDGNYEKRDDDLTRFRVQTEWSQTYGLIIKVRDYLSSNKKKVNTKSASSTKTVYEKTISDPDQVVKTLFGSDARVEQTYKIEDLIDLIVNNFKDDKEKLNKIMEQSIIKVILAIYIDLSHKGWSEWGYPPKMNQYVTDPDSRKNIAIEVDRKVYNNEKIAQNDVQISRQDFGFEEIYDEFRDEINSLGDQSKKTIAFIPGSFKPCTEWHRQMFEHYLKLVGDNGRVIISISQPTKAGSMRKGDGIDVISAEKAKEIIDIVLKDLNIGNGRITTQVSKNPSPVSDAWDIAGYNKEFMLANGVENCNLILGTGSKDKDVERFDGIFQKTLNGTMKNDCKKELGVNLQNPRSTVFTSKDWDGQSSATTARDNAQDDKVLRDVLPHGLSDGAFNQIVGLIRGGKKPTKTGGGSNEVTDANIEKFKEEHDFYALEKNGTPKKQKKIFVNSDGVKMKWKSNKVPDDNPNEMGAYYAEVIDPETYASKEIRWSIKKCVQDMKSTQEQPEEQEPEEVRITPEQIEQFKKDHKFYDKDKNGNPVKQKLSYKNSDGLTLKWKANEHPDDKPDETGAYVGVFVGNQGTEEYVKWSIEKCVADQLGMNPSEDGHGQKAERTVADVVNNWIEKKSGETNPHINDVVDNNDDEFYAVKFGKSSASDILVVHDKDKHNIDKKNVGINDRTFFIEVKDGASQSRSFCPRVKIVGDDKGFQYKFAGIQIPENIGDESEVTKYKDIMTRGRFGEIITKIMGQESVKMFETFKNIIDMFEQIQSKSRDNLKIGGTFEFPSDFDKLPQIFDYIMEQIASNYNQDNELANLIKSNGWTPEKIIEVYNKNKDSILRSSGIHSKERSEYVDMDAQKMDAMIHNMDSRQKIVFLITLVGGSLDFAKIDIGDYKEVAESDQSDVDKTSKLDMFSWALTSWYRDMKQTAYMEIMADNSGSGGIYLFDKDFDPLNLQTKFSGRIQLLRDALIGAQCRITRKDNTMALMTEIRIKPNGLHFKDILGKEFKIGTNDLSHDESEFFKGTDNQKRIWDSGN